MIELTEAGLRVESQKPFSVNYKGKVIGEYKTDIIVEEKVLLELKSATDKLLKAIGIKVGLLINFTLPKATIKRIVF